MIKLNGHPISVTVFPDNTSQVWKIPYFELLTVAYIDWTYSNEGEIIQLAQLKDLLRDLPCHLDVKYLPYGRQDKEVSNSATFALHTFAKILNGLNFTSIKIRDPHSEMACTLLRNSVAYYPLKELARARTEFRADIYCYPDMGAYSKYNTLHRFMCVNAVKTRDQDTGVITGMEFTSQAPLAGARVLVVDDICDGGATFIELAKLLKSRDVAEMALFVTHGIFSKGVLCLFKAGYTRIWTADEEITRSYTRLYR